MKVRLTFQSSYYRRMQVSFLLLVLLPTLLAAYFNYSIIQKSVRDKVTLNNDAVLALMAKDIDKTIDDLTYASNFFVQDENVLEQLRKFDNVKGINSSADLDAYMALKNVFSLVDAKTMTPDILMYITNNQQFIVQSVDFTFPEPLDKQYTTISKRVNENLPNVLQWLGSVPGQADPGRSYYYLARVLRDPNSLQPIGTLFIVIPDSYFLKLFSQIQPANIALFDESGERIAGSAAVTNTSEAKDDPFIRSVKMTERSHWTLVLETPRQEITGPILRAFRISLLAVLPFFVLFLLLSLVVARRLHAPIRRLQKGIRQFGEGNLAIRFHTSGDDEISDLGKTLNVMLERINQLIVGIKDEQEQKQALELQALFSQIRPHFLLNTLNSIKCNLELDDAKEHSSTIESLMSLLRAYMQISEPTDLQNECRLLFHYVDIMRMRSDIQVELDVQLAEELRTLPFPKLLLQPLVENAIVHGFDEESESPMIVMQAVKTEEGYVEIRITDNGTGIDEEKLVSLNGLLDGEGEAMASYKQVGLVNVLQRLRLTYGRDAAMRLARNGSVEPGITVLLRFRYEKAERRRSGDAESDVG